MLWSYQRSWDLTVWKGSSCQSCYLLQKGVLRGSFSVLPFSWFISEDQLHPKESFTFYTSRDPWIIEKDLSTLKKKDSIFLFFMIAASQKILTLPTYCWCDLSARKLKMFFFLKKKCNICNNTRKRHRCRTLRMKERAKIFWNLVSSSVMGIKNIKVKQK